MSHFQFENKSVISCHVPSIIDETRLDLQVSVSGDMVTLSCSSVLGGEIVGKDSIYLNKSEAKKLSVILYQSLIEQGEF